MDKMDNKNLKKSLLNFTCIKCNYVTSKKTDYEKHLLTAKHTRIIMDNSSINSKNKTICVCGKKYIFLSGLCKHKKKCEFLSKNKNENIKNDNINNFSSELFIDILKQNQEFKELIVEQNKQILEQNKQIIELSSNININNYNTNCNNKTFNLQVFLNEKCKDALNITDFVNSLKLTLEDLENVGEKGFVDGITRIFVNGLKKLDVYKRPIHCSDLKRETMYLKNENVWEKDNDNKENMKKVIKQIANKNINKIYEWKDKYPDCKYSDSKKNDQYSRIILESMGARTVEEDQVLYEKIIKNIAKETTIDKTK